MSERRLDDLVSRRIYVASSWRNRYHPALVKELRRWGHEVYDFRNPRAGNNWFHWSEIDPKWEQWDEEAYRRALAHPVALAGFASDFEAMEWANTGVLLLPCGRSAHLEAGYFVGARKPLHVLMLEPQEPELMYRMATSICLDEQELSDALDGDEQEAQG